MRRLEVVVDSALGIGSGLCGIPGGTARLVALAVIYDAACPATTDVVVGCTLPAVKTLLTITDNNADIPLAQITEVEVDTSGTPRATPANVPQLISGELTVDIADCHAALPGAVTVVAIIE